MLFRSSPTKMPRIVEIVIVSRGNSGATWLSTLNTFLIGIVFSLLFYYHDTVWLVSGFHSGWNFILGPVLGVAVSGFELPTSVLATHSNMTRAGLNGGAYGFEAGYPVLVLCLILIVGYAALILKNRARFINDSKKVEFTPYSPIADHFITSTD